MEITIILRDDEDGQVQVEETRRPGPGEDDQSVTTATVLADEMFSLLDELGEEEPI